MENIFDRLQFVKHENVFATREEAINYVLDKQVVERPTVVAEPMVLLYENSDATKGPNVILAIGSVGNGRPNANNRTFFIDTQKTAEEIEALDEKIEEAIKSLTVIPLESNTVKLFSDNNEDGTVLSGDVKLADYRISTAGTVNYNILQTEGNKGLYAFVDMNYDPETFAITFNVNGVTKEFELPKDKHIKKGEYDEINEEIVLTLADDSKVKIDVVKLIDEWTVVGSASTTPVVLFKEHVSSYTESHEGIYGWQDLLTADVRVAEHVPHNILHKDGTGRYLVVEGTADNIHYKSDLTVKDALDNIDTNISTSAGNLIYKRHDGIFAAAMLTYDKTRNTLIYKYSDGESESVITSEIELNSLQVLHDITYDPTNEVLVIRYIDEKGDYQRVEIPVKDIIEEWDVVNEGHTILLNKQRSTGSGKDMLSADAKIYNGANNILEDKDHTLYVNGVSDNIKYTSLDDTTVKSVLDNLSASTASLDEKIDEEISNRIQSDNKFNDTIGTGFTTDPHENITYKFNEFSGNVASEINSLVSEDAAINERVATEIVRSTAKDNEHDAKIADVETTIGTGFSTDGHETVTYKFNEFSANVTSEINNLVNEDASINERLSSEISRSTTKDGEHDVKIGNVETTIGTGFSTDSHETVTYKFNEIENSLNDEIERATSIETSLRNDLNYEASRSIEKDNEHDAKIQEINEAIAELSADTGGKVDSIVNNDHSIDVDNTDSVNPVIKVNLSTEIESGKENIIKLNNDGLYAGVDLTYNFDPNAGKNELIFSTTNGVKYIELKTNSVVDRIYYDSVKEAIIIEYTINGVRQPDVVVPVGDLITEWRVWDGHEGAIQLTKERKASGTSEQDILKAAVVISTHNDNILVNDGGTLYVTSSGITKNATDITALQNRTSTLETNVSSLDSRLTAEVSRATDAERTLSTDLASEISRATGEDTRIEDKLDAEIIRSTAKDEELAISATSNASNIQTEKTRAISAETALQTAINSETTRATNAETTINTKLDTEINRAVGVETTLRNDLDAEVSRSADKDLDLETALTAEVSRATNAEAALTTSVNTERTRALSAETALQTAIDNESARATNAETAIDTKINNEVSRSTQKDSELQISINTVVSNLENEVNRAKNVESALTDDLTEEITRAKEAESAITNSLNAEVTRATDAETLLQERISNEAVLRDNADSNLNTLITNEASRAASAESALQTSLTNETSRATSAESALQTAIGSEENRATSAETALDNRISGEIARASSAETALQTAISNEATRATNAETTLNTKIDGEIARSTAKETELANLISAETAARIAKDEELSETLTASTLTFDDTTTIDLNKSAENVVTANVKVANSNDNIIKISGENAGIFASVRLGYDSATNKIRIITSNGAQDEIQLNAGALLDTIVYDSINRVLVITYHDSNGVSHTMNVPVNELFNDWVVDNPSEDSAIELTKVTNGSGYSDTLSGRIVLTNLDDNIVKIVSNGLYVSGALISAATASSECVKSELTSVEKAVFGNESIPECGAGFVYHAPNGSTYIANATNINNATYLLDQTVRELSSYTASLESKITESSGDTQCVQNELNITQDNVLGMSVPKCGLNDNGTEFRYLANAGTNYIASATSFNNADIILDREIKNTNDIMSVIGDSLSAATDDIDDLSNEINCLENGIGFGSGTCEYHPSTGSVISAATSLYNADQLLDNAVKALDDKVDNMLDGSDTTSSHVYIENDALKVDVRLSHGNTTPGMSDSELIISGTNDSEITDTNALRLVEITGQADDSTFNGLYLSNIWNCGEYTANGAGTPNNKYKIDDSTGASNINYGNYARQNNV